MTFSATCSRCPSDMMYFSLTQSVQRLTAFIHCFACIWSTFIFYLLFLHASHFVAVDLSAPAPVPAVHTGTKKELKCRNWMVRSGMVQHSSTCLCLLLYCSLTLQITAAEVRFSSSCLTALDCKMNKVSSHFCIPLPVIDICVVSVCFGSLLWIFNNSAPKCAIW